MAFLNITEQIIYAAKGKTNKTPTKQNKQKNPKPKPHKNKQKTKRKPNQAPLLQ